MRSSFGAVHFRKLQFGCARDVTRACSGAASYHVNAPGHFGTAGMLGVWRVCRCFISLDGMVTAQLHQVRDTSRLHFLDLDARVQQPFPCPSFEVVWLFCLRKALVASSFRNTCLSPFFRQRRRASGTISSFNHSNLAVGLKRPSIGA